MKDNHRNIHTFYFGDDTVVIYDKEIEITVTTAGVPLDKRILVDTWGIEGLPGIVIVPFDNNLVFSVTQEKSFARIASIPHRSLVDAVQFVYELMHGVKIDWNLSMQAILDHPNKEQLRLLVQADYMRSLSQSGSLEEFNKRQKEAGKGG